MQQCLFELFTRVEACRALSRAVLIHNAAAQPPALAHAIAAKTFCTGAALEVTDRAIQLFGGRGLSRE